MQYSQFWHINLIFPIKRKAVLSPLGHFGPTYQTNQMCSSLKTPGQLGSHPRSCVFTAPVSWTSGKLRMRRDQGRFPVSSHAPKDKKVEFSGKIVSTSDGFLYFLFLPSFCLSLPQKKPLLIIFCTLTA